VYDQHNQLLGFHHFLPRQISYAVLFVSGLR